MIKTKEIELLNQEQYRIIPSTYPPINFFEDLVDPSEMEVLWEIESLTNERLRQEAGDIFLVPPEDRIAGPGSSIVMAAFTYIGKPTRFSDGSFGVYYAGLSQETAIKETVYQRECFLKATNEIDCEITMRIYQGKILKPMHNITNSKYKELHDPNDYTLSQQFGLDVKKNNSWGIIYNSIRHKEGRCIAALRPPAVSIPKELGHLRYVWDGKKITDVLHLERMIFT